MTTALQQQNIQVGAGAIGKEPAPDNQSFEFALRATSRFKDAAEFEDMVLKVSQGGTNSSYGLDFCLSDRDRLSGAIGSV